MIGGTLPLLHSGYRVGQGDTIILESCEYCNSFLNFFPTVAVILNVEEDHLDFFKDLADIEHSFHAFADLVPQRGYIISNADDAGATGLCDRDCSTRCSPSPYRIGRRTAWRTTCPSSTAARCLTW